MSQGSKGASGINNKLEDRDYSFSTYAKFSEKTTFLNP